MSQVTPQKMEHLRAYRISENKNKPLHRSFRRPPANRKNITPLPRKSDSLNVANDVQLGPVPAQAEPQPAVISGGIQAISIIEMVGPSNTIQIRFPRWNLSYALQ